jgi:hypothetical protein
VAPYLFLNYEIDAITAPLFRSFFRRFHHSVANGVQPVAKQLDYQWAFQMKRWSPTETKEQIDKNYE